MDTTIRRIIVLGAILVFGTSAFGQEAAQGGNFFTQFVVAGGPIVWLVLVPMSVATLYLGVDLLLTVRKRKLLPGNIAGILERDYFRLPRGTFHSRLRKRDDMVSRAVDYTLTHSPTLKQHIRYIHQLAAESISRQSLPISRRVEWAGIIGNVAPMVGLFGTVFGMIEAFNLLGIAGGQPRPDQLAAAISIALVTTFWGLLVAIPALAIHGIFSSRLDNLTHQAAIETENVLRAITRDKQPTEAEALDADTDRQTAEAK